MSKNNFIENFCKENNFSYKKGKEILKNLYLLISSELKENGNICFKNFGKFYLKEKQEKMNNFTGKIVPRHLFVAFKASKKFREVVEK